MDRGDLQALLEAVREGALTSDDAIKQLSMLPYADLGFARVDHHRAVRQGIPEAVFAKGKTPEQCAAIVAEMLSSGSGPVVLTRATPDQLAAVLEQCPGATVTPEGGPSDVPRLAAWRPAARKEGLVLVVTAGTADLPVANECIATLSALGYTPTLLADCGVAGVHRLLAEESQLRKCDVCVVIAGMEGALASVVGGIVPSPVVAVPTSVGYGASFEGLTALLSMLSSCAAGITVVGIDNGFGAACAVARMLR